MTRTRVKICGMTSPEDAAEAARLGVDAIGLVFWPRSSRAVSRQQAREITAALPPFVTPVALFVDPERDEVEDVLTALPGAALQFHGSESPAFCAGFSRPWIKALGMKSNVDCEGFARDYRGARAILVDAHAHGDAGGTGEAFDWQRVPRERDFRLLLAGGLTPDNVAAAVQAVQPDGVDVSSGVERTKGRKDAHLMREFIEEVRRGDRGERRDDA